MERDPTTILLVSEKLVSSSGSAGSTGAAKGGCPLTHEAIVRTGDALNTRFSLTQEDVWWDPLPMFHLSSILPLTAALRAGSRYVTMVDFEVDDAVKQIVEERVTYMFGTFPTLNQELLAHPGFRGADLSSVRFINQVAPPDMQRALQAALPHVVQVSAYGCTELGGIISQNDPGETPEQRATGCGTPFPGIEVRIVDPDSGHDLPAGAVGEIVARGFGMFEGYHNDPVRTAEAIEPGGWFHTGDIGSVDEAGRIAYHGRTKDMLKVGGENVAALEVESYLSRHPAVRLAQVVSIPDTRLDEVPAAFVEIEPGHDVTEEELIAFCRGRSRASRFPATSGSSLPGRCPRRRSRSSSCATNCSPTSTRTVALTVILTNSRIFKRALELSVERPRSSPLRYQGELR